MIVKQLKSILKLAYLATAHVLRGRFTQQKVDKVAGLEASHKLSSI